MSGWEVLTGRAPLPSGVLAEVEALRAALSGYDVTVTRHSPAYRFEAIRRQPGAGPWCVISGDPADLWRELAPCHQPTAPGGTQIEDPGAVTHTCTTGTMEEAR